VCGPELNPSITKGKKKIPNTKKKKKKDWARRQWLMPIILPTQEAEIRRISVQSQTQKNSSRDPILKKPTQKKGLVEWLKV
jgi:hypothetical protein